jgi:hypothetical protein
LRGYIVVYCRVEKNQVEPLYSRSGLKAKFIWY